MHGSSKHLNKEKKIKVLHIEDNLADQQLIAAYLQDAKDVSFELAQVDRLSKAQKILENEKFDIILLDLNLPDSSGKDLYDTICRETSQRDPIVILSATYQEKQSAVQMLELGAQDFLIKFNLQAESLVRSLIYAIERKKLERLKDDFIGTVSHELRTPLTVMGLGLETIKSGMLGSLNEKQAEVIEINVRNGKRLGKMIDNLLDLSRLQSGRTKIATCEINLKHLTHEVIQNFQTTKQGGGYFFQEGLAVDLPTADGDPDLISQIMTNLLSNAVRYAREKIVVTAEVMINRLVTACASPFIQVSVANDGPGIPREKLDLLFGKFVQLDRAERMGSYKGTGLGLAICKEIIEQHKGTIWVESPGERGVTFHFTLPIFARSEGQ